MLEAINTWRIRWISVTPNTASRAPPSKTTASSCALANVRAACVSRILTASRWPKRPCYVRRTDVGGVRKPKRDAQSSRERRFPYPFPLIAPLIHPPIHSTIQPFSHSFTHRFFHPFTHPCKPTHTPGTPAARRRTSGAPAPAPTRTPPPAHLWPDRGRRNHRERSVHEYVCMHVPTRRRTVRARVCLSIIHEYMRPCTVRACVLRTCICTCLYVCGYMRLLYLPPGPKPRCPPLLACSIVERAAFISTRRRSHACQVRYVCMRLRSRPPQSSSFKARPQTTHPTRTHPHTLPPLNALNETTHTSTSSPSRSQAACALMSHSDWYCSQSATWPSTSARRLRMAAYACCVWGCIRKDDACRLT